MEARWAAMCRLEHERMSRWQRAVAEQRAKSAAEVAAAAVRDAQTRVGAAHVAATARAEELEAAQAAMAAAGEGSSGGVARGAGEDERAAMDALGAATGAVSSASAVAAAATAKLAKALDRSGAASRAVAAAAEESKQPLPPYEPPADDESGGGGGGGGGNSGQQQQQQQQQQQLLLRLRMPFLRFVANKNRPAEFAAEAQRILDALGTRLDGACSAKEKRKRRSSSSSAAAAATAAGVAGAAAAPPPPPVPSFEKWNRALATAVPDVDKLLCHALAQVDAGAKGGSSIAPGASRGGVQARANSAATLDTPRLVNGLMLLDAVTMRLALSLGAVVALHRY